MMRIASALLACGLFLGQNAAAWAAPPMSFSRDVLPILSGKCFTCHGPDAKERKAELRLDMREAALKPAESGETAVVPGDIKRSELIRRIELTNEDRMPPGAGKQLSDKEKSILKDWIASGAEYQPHWSFMPPKRPALPATGAGQSNNAIDRFIVERLEREGLKLSPEADRYTLARRVALDLTGLPPTLEQADQFASDPSPDAYERFVDQMLASPAFGERWAHAWLDLARYADSNGYANDNPRSIWKYRDWVINACNGDLPFDQFTTHQLAGDMLDSPTTDQLLATAFHRNTLTNDEGGTNDEEFRTAAVVDRVNTTMQVWMGLTMQCAQCHTHKYDPISQEEYFRVYAIFNQTEDADRGDNSPLLSTPTPEEEVRKTEMVAELARLEKLVAEPQAKPATSNAPASAPRTGPLASRYVRVENLGEGVYLHLAEVEVFVGDKNVALKGKATQVSTDFGGPAKRGNDGNTSGEFANNSVTHTAVGTNPWWEVDLGSPQVIDKIVIWNRTDSGTEERLKTWRVATLDEKRQPTWVKTYNEPARPSQAATPPKTGETLTVADQAEIQTFAAGQAPAPSEEQKQIEKLKKQIAAFKGVSTPVMKELPEKNRRKTNILVRGNFLDLGPEVQPGVLQVFHPLPANAPANRLALTQWLLDEANPLTARVAVNRYWEQMFGMGLVASSEDFGLRGQAPTHPELLDWLAVEFRETGWSVKQLLRSIVTSATYRQTSHVSAALAERDPENLLYARGPRFRSSAEIVRDQTLFAAGLLRPKMLGPSVRPERPKQRLSAAFGGATDWETSPGEDKFRRGLYTEWRRTAPYPSMVTFDAPNRTVCVMRRPRTNTPLQALVTLNDPVYVEAAQALSRRVLEQGGVTAESRVQFAFRLAATRPPRAEETARLLKLFEETKAAFAGNPTGANTLATKPYGPLPKEIDHVEAAAWTVVSNVVLNLDECFAKR